MRIPLLNSETDVINFHVNCYYIKVKAEPELRLNPSQHEQAIEEINERYLLALAKNPSFDQEHYKDSFLLNIDFLTQIFTKKKNQQALSARKAEFRERFKK